MITAVYVQLQNQTVKLMRMEKISPEVKGQLPKTGPGYAHDNLPLEFEPPTLPDLEADAVIRAATLPLFLNFL